MTEFPPSLSPHPREESTFICVSMATVFKEKRIFKSSDPSVLWKYVVMLWNAKNNFIVT